MTFHKKPLRICAISFYYFPIYSGSAVQARNLIRFLKERGVETFIVTANLNKLPCIDMVDGTCVYRLPVIRSKNLTIFSFSLMLAWFLLKRRKDYDIIHAHGTFQNGIASIIGRILGKRTILKITMAKSDIAFERQGRVWGKVNRFLVNKFDTYIAISKNIAQEILDKGLDSSRVVYLPNGVDTEINTVVDVSEKKKALKVKCGLPECEIVSFVGIINQRKNIDFILSCWQEIKKRDILGHLLLIGPYEQNDPYFSGLVQFIEEEKLTDTVSFLGFQQSVGEYLQSSDIFLFPSKQEGMPNVLLEAMACGLSCVASKISGNEDIIEHEKNGFLLPLARKDLFVETLCDLMCDETKRKSIGMNARQFVMDNFSLNKIARDYELLYRKLL